MLTRFYFVCFAFVTAAFCVTASHASGKPNIVIILADDFGYECVAANGGSSYQTPHLDALAKSGIRFTHCYAQPLCTPTRVQLMTGQSNVRNYIRFGYLDPQQTTFAQLLKRAGYATGIVGKWQLGHGLKGPAQFGFDEYCLWQLTRRPSRYANPGLEIDGREVDFKNGEYGPDVVHQYALDFVRKHMAEPFLLYYPMMLTHGPFVPTPTSADWDPKAATENEHNNTKHFPEMVQHLDKLVGTLVARLEELQIRDNTLILFVGDNGTGRKIYSSLAGRKIEGGKGSVTEAGTRVPFIANWPARIVGGKVCDDLVDTTDFLPTICAAAAVEVPAVVDGRSVLPQLQGEPGTPREWLYGWYAPNQNKVDVPIVFARDHHYKLYGGGKLVKLEEDGYKESPIETDNASSEAAAAGAKLLKVLDSYSEARPVALRDGPLPAKKRR